MPRYLPVRIGGVIADSGTCIVEALERALDTESNLITNELVQMRLTRSEFMGDIGEQNIDAAVISNTSS